MRKESNMKNELELCVPCAEKLKEGYDVKKAKSGVNKKVTCAACGKRRYGAVYEVTGKK